MTLAPHCRPRFTSVAVYRKPTHTLFLTILEAGAKTTLYYGILRQMSLRIASIGTNNGKGDTSWFKGRIEQCTKSRCVVLLPTRPHTLALIGLTPQKSGNFQLFFVLGHRQ